MYLQGYKKNICRESGELVTFILWSNLIGYTGVMKIADSMFLQGFHPYSHFIKNIPLLNISMDHITMDMHI